MNKEDWTDQTKDLPIKCLTCGRKTDNAIVCGPNKDCVFELVDYGDRLVSRNPICFHVYGSCDTHRPRKCVKCGQEEGTTTPIQEPRMSNPRKKLDGDDPVNHPSHYTDGKIEVIDFIDDKRLNFCRGNAVKYISRAGKKDPSKEVQDLEKAVWYLQHEINKLKAP